MVILYFICIQVFFVNITSVTGALLNTFFSENLHEKSITFQSKFTEQLTNIEFVYVNNYNDYHLYKLIQKYDSTTVQITTANRLFERYLRESFETPDRNYPYVTQSCGTTIMAFFIRNITVATRNINALLLGRTEAYDNSKYICFLSVLKQHRQKGLGTKLLNEFIKDTIRTKTPRISLHVNTENANALSLYTKCGMRCVRFIPNYYVGDRTYSTQNAFDMSLQLKYVKNSTAICYHTNAVEIPSQEAATYKRECPQSFPKLP